MVIQGVLDTLLSYFICTFMILTMLAVDKVVQRIQVTGLVNFQVSVPLYQHIKNLLQLFFLWSCDPTRAMASNS